ncbi:hypothetical protein C5167_047577 [Papaver somniferum]|uniref:Uncharacterized protein n=1 Tax=Papaver somniferum TaxID=3469 RepID=A0A4Y7LH29_PAPSO|nr:hypothetical protein C5167_047577 [Papaver somniferum]
MVHFPLFFCMTPPKFLIIHTTSICSLLEASLFPGYEDDGGDGEEIADLNGRNSKKPFYASSPVSRTKYSRRILEIDSVVELFRVPNSITLPKEG